MPVIAEVVDGGALVKVVWASALAGLGVTVAFSIAILGASRAIDLRRDGRTAEATLFAIGGAAALAVFSGAIVLGIVVMLSK